MDSRTVLMLGGICLSAIQAGHASDPSPADSVTFSDQIAPIVRANCIECHRTGGSGPFPLETYEQVRRRARQIAEVTADRYMPPWKPDRSVTPPMQDARGLSDAEIALFATWKNSGCLAGDLSSLPPVPSFPGGWVLGQPDTVLEFDESYTLPGDGQDIYRNFVLPRSVTRERQVRAVELLPGTQLAIHHALLLVDHSALSRRRDESEPGAGFGGMILGNAGHPDGHFVGWTPGQRPFQAFPGTSWALNPSDDLVLQLHMTPTGKPEAIRPRLGLHFTDEKPDRETFVIQLRELSIDIPAGEANYRVRSEFTLPCQVEAIGVYPHAHYLGKELNVYADLPDGGRQWIVRIPDWDFNWQMDYRFVAPVTLPTGAVIVMDYTYDNSVDNPHNPSDPPVRVRGGGRSVDEMAEVAIQVLVDDPQEIAALMQETVRRRFESDGFALTTYILGKSHEEAGDLKGAEKVYNMSLEADPDFAPALTQLGVISYNRGDTRAGVEYFERAFSSDPSSPEVLWNLGRARFDLGEKREAVGLLSRLLEAAPQHREGRVLLALSKVEAGEISSAIELLDQGLRWHGADAGYRLQLAKLLLANRQTHEARVQLDHAMEVATSSDATTTAEIAYVLAVLSHQARDSAAANRYLIMAENADPAHTASRVLHAAILISSGDVAAARRTANELASIDEARLPDPSRLVASLPFPAGSLLVAEALRAHGKEVFARAVLDAALTRARHDGNRSAIDAISVAMSETEHY